MKKIKINIKPLATHVKKVKKNLVNYELNFKKKYKVFKNQSIFTNLLALICFFWIVRNQNILETLINNKQIKKAPINESTELISIFNEIINFSQEIASKNFDKKYYFENEMMFQNKSKEYTNQLINIYINNSINNTLEIEAIEKCLNNLINFNFIDLFTTKLEVLNQNDDTNKYDDLILLIEKQMKYLNDSYIVFKNANSPNFNFVFKVILTFRKKIY
ncbi:hypothetical protein [Mycoplasmoides pirum]|uniref:hypothetical protein n=1 Tax=Mycoplasmoides pirum TaxID=2122 RepID=UPI00048590C7|nr:hypothetical protein [Mycoplasmoides pirum]